MLQLPHVIADYTTTDPTQTIGKTLSKEREKYCLSGQNHLTIIYLETYNLFMKQLQNDNIAANEFDECAGLILETVPFIMRVIRSDRRELGGDVLPLPHFRVLAHLKRNPESSLSSLAEEIGLTLPSISKIVDALFDKGFVSRRESETDRRYLRLSVTPEGMKVLQAAKLETQRKLTLRLQETSPEQCALINEGLRSLREIFTQRKNNGVGKSGE